MQIAPCGHATLETSRVVAATDKAAAAALRGVNCDGIVGLAPALGGLGHAVADLHGLHRLNAHEGTRE